MGNHQTKFDNEATKTFKDLARDSSKPDAELCLLVIHALEEGADPNATMEFGGCNIPVLHPFIIHGKLKCVQEILKMKPDLESGSSNGMTALQIALQSILKNNNNNNNEDSVAMVRLLLDFGADVNASKSRQSSPLNRAIHSKIPGVVAELIKKKPTALVNPKTLLLAADGGNAEIVIALLGANAVLGGTRSDGATPLIVAACRGHLKVVEALVDFGADINASTDVKNTALHLAAEAGYIEVVQALMELGANIHAKNGANETALHLAAIAGRAQVCVALINKEIDTKAKNNRQYTALDEAIVNNRVEVVATMLHLQQNASFQQVNDFFKSSNFLLDLLKYNQISMFKLLFYLLAPAITFCQVDGDNLLDAAMNIQCIDAVHAILDFKSIPKSASAKDRAEFWMANFNR
jgi:ankyrin repeat protein